MSGDNKAEEKTVLAHVSNAISNVEMFAMNHYHSVSNAIRTLFDRFTGSVDGKKDINNECNYPSQITLSQYKEIFDREAIGARIVSLLPEESWADDPWIYETEDVSQQTEFERGIEILNDEHSLYEMMLRADILSKIGHYGIIVFGLNDANNIDTSLPVEGYDEASEKWNENLSHSLLYIRAYSEPSITIDRWETRTNSPRFGKPVIYSVTYKDYLSEATTTNPLETKTMKFHWTRCHHLADNCLDSDTKGTPELKPVYNNVYNLRKIYGASAEGYWKNAFPSLIFEMSPEAAAKINASETLKGAIKEQLERLSESLQKYMVGTGSVKTVAGTINDPTPHIAIQLQAICIALEVPWRIFLGSEEAKYASAEDKKAWNKRLMRRQTKYIIPKIIRPVINRLMDYGVLPRVEKFSVEFPDLNKLTPEELAESAEKKTKALALYTQSNLESIMTREDYYSIIWGFDDELIQQIIENADKNQKAYSGDEQALTQDGNDTGSVDQSAQ